MQFSIEILKVRKPVIPGKRDLKDLNHFLLPRSGSTKK